MKDFREENFEIGAWDWKTVFTKIKFENNLELKLFKATKDANINNIKEEKYFHVSIKNKDGNDIYPLRDMNFKPIWEILNKYTKRLNIIAFSNIYYEDVQLIYEFLSNLNINSDNIYYTKEENEAINNINNFLKELTKLSSKYNVFIEGCEYYGENPYLTIDNYDKLKLNFLDLTWVDDKYEINIDYNIDFNDDNE